MRTLLIHEFRRVSLHDPQLPAALLPADWPGPAAYGLCRDFYRRTHQCAEQHLAATLETRRGALPPAAVGGAYQVVIDADAGPGRQASVPVVFSVAGPAHLVVPSAALLAAPQGEALWTRTLTAWRSFPSRLPLLAATLLVVANSALLGTSVWRKRRYTAVRVD